MINKPNLHHEYDMNKTLNYTELTGKCKQMAKAIASGNNISCIYEGHDYTDSYGWFGGSFMTDKFGGVCVIVRYTGGILEYCINNEYIPVEDNDIINIFDEIQTECIRLYNIRCTDDFYDEINSIGD